jgi:FKBP-type peptidyl-prolyl cis-trans isomerase SlyD
LLTFDAQIIFMQITNNKVVSLTYELKIQDEGEMLLVEKVTAEQPFVFLYGMSGLPERFEESLANLKAGDAFNFILSKEESGYGEYDQAAIVDLPKDVFMIDGKFDAEEITVGRFIPMSDTEGNRMQGLVLEIGDMTVKMDFNHPLSGKELNFSGNVSDVREATAEELDHGHVHGEGGHHH